MATTPQPPPPPPLDPISAPSSKKPQPIPWTHQETTYLIQAYQQLWYSHKKGPLKSSQWEEVSIAVAVRCGYDDEPSKSATQCRHKMEKLRQRYRSEIQLRRRSSWPYFDLMNQLSLGPLPISTARPLTIVNCTEQRNNTVDDDDDKIDDDDDRCNNKLRSIHHLLRTPAVVNRKVAAEGIGYIRKHVELPPPAYAAANTVAQEREEMGGDRLLREMAVEIRGFTERFVKMENVKMEMTREVERYRMEMEGKRMEMILDSQRKIVDTIGKAFGSLSNNNKKLKITNNNTQHHV